MSEPQLPPPPDDDFERAAQRFFDDAPLFAEVPQPPTPEPEPEPEPQPQFEPEPQPEPEALPEPEPLPEPELDPFVAPATELPILDATPPAYSSSIPNELAEMNRHRLRRGVLMVLGAWLVVAVGMIAFGIISLQNAQAQLSGTQKELSLANFDESSVTGAEATADSMGRAHSMFASPVVAPLKIVPVFGRQLRSLSALSHAAQAAIRVGIDARQRALPIARTAPKDGAGRVKTLKAARDIAHDGNAALAKLDLGPGKNLIGPLAKTRSKFVAELNRIGELLQRTEAGSDGLAQFLKGPSRYAVFAANNAEMRAGSGMYLSAGTLEVKDGELNLGPMRSIYELPPAPNNVALEYDYLRLWGLQAPGSDYRFVNMTPRFPTSAALLQRMWAASGAEPVDGILVVDPVAAVQLLKLVGEVKVGDKTINATNGLQWFLHDQYLDTKGTKKTQQRRDGLADVVQAVFGRLNSGQLEPRALGEALSTAVEGRHLMAWTPTKNVQQAWNAVGMDGTLPDESLLFALQNRGGNKLDYFQRVSAIAHATVSKAGSRIDVEFLLTNATPDNEPQYVAGPVSGSFVKEPNVYVGYASVNLPKDARDVTFTGAQGDLVEGPDGNTQVKSLFVQLGQNKTVRLRLSFTLPPGTRALTILPSARVPNVFWHVGDVSWHDTKAQVITW